MTEYLLQILDTFRIFLWIFLVLFPVIWFRALTQVDDPLLVLFPELRSKLLMIVKWLPVVILIIVLLLFFLPSSASLTALLA